MHIRRWKWTRIILVIFGIFIFNFTSFNSPSFCEEIEKETIRLKDIIKDALEKNPDIQAVYREWKAAEARVPQARSLNDPWIGIEWENIPKGKFSPFDADMTLYSVNQEFPAFGKLSLRGRVAIKESKIAEELYNEKVRDVLAQVKVAYYELFLTYKSIEINENNKNILSRFAKIAEVKYTVGKAPQQDVLKAQVELSKIINELITLRQMKETAQAKLNTLLNRKPESSLGIPEEFKSPEVELTIDKLFGLAVENRPELKSMKLMIERNEILYSLAKKEYYPDYMVKITQKESEGWNTMIGLSIPLWYRTKQNYLAKETQEEIEKSKKAYQNTKNMIFFQIKDYLVRTQTAERLVNLYKTSILPQAEQSLKASLIGYETGKVDFLNLLDAQRMILDFQLDYYKALVDFEQRFAELERTVGIDLK